MPALKAIWAAVAVANIFLSSPFHVRALPDAMEDKTTIEKRGRALAADPIPNTHTTKIPGAPVFKNIACSIGDPHSKCPFMSLLCMCRFIFVRLLTSNSICFCNQSTRSMDSSMTVMEKGSSFLPNRNTRQEKSKCATSTCR